MTGEIRSYRDLIAWQKGIALCKQVCAVTGGFPEGERFGLVTQMRRAAVSIPSNIAEGYGRRSRRDYLRYLDIARGSLAELETQLSIAHELGMLSEGALQSGLSCSAEVDRIVWGLIQGIEESATAPRGKR